MCGSPWNVANFHKSGADTASWSELFGFVSFYILPGHLPLPLPPSFISLISPGSRTASAGTNSGTGSILASEYNSIKFPNSDAMLY